jgi:hypothetical protein
MYLNCRWLFISNQIRQVAQQVISYIFNQMALFKHLYTLDYKLNESDVNAAFKPSSFPQEEL